MKFFPGWFQSARSRSHASASISSTAEDQAPNKPQTEKKSFSAGFVSLFSGGAAMWSGNDYASSVQHGFLANPVVFRCVRMIGEAAASIPVLAYDGKLELDQHPALDLLKNPNPHHTGSGFLETAYAHLVVGGNCYWHMQTLDGEPREINLLRPDHVSVLSDQSGWPSAYEYRLGSTSQRFSASAARPEVLHLRQPNPGDDVMGVSPLAAANMALNIHNAASTWNKALLDNAARPSGALVYAGPEGANLTDEQFERLKGELEDGYTGARNAGRPLLLEGGLDWKAMGYSPKDMDFIEAKHSAARDIALAFGLPPMLLGIPGDNTYSNYREANRAFWLQTVLPLARRTMDSVSRWLSLHLEEPVRLVLDTDQIDALADERNALWERMNAATFLSDDEKRDVLGFSRAQKVEAASIPANEGKYHGRI